MRVRQQYAYLLIGFVQEKERSDNDLESSLKLFNIKQENKNTHISRRKILVAEIYQCQAFCQAIKY